MIDEIEYFADSPPPPPKTTTKRFFLIKKYKIRRKRIDLCVVRHLISFLGSFFLTLTRQSICVTSSSTKYVVLTFIQRRQFLFLLPHSPKPRVVRENELQTGNTTHTSTSHLPSIRTPKSRQKDTGDIQEQDT